jgi:hypothetical protein
MPCHHHPHSATTPLTLPRLPAPTSLPPQDLPNVNGNTSLLTWNISTQLTPLTFQLKFTRVAWDPSLMLQVSLDAAPAPTFSNKSY